LNKQSSVNLKEVYNKMLSDASAKDIFTQDDIKEETADMQLFTNDEVFDFLKIQADRKSRGVFLYMYDKYTKLYPGLLSSHPELNEIREKMLNLSELNIEELMKSVVTVILDRGINIKKGMGFIDKSLGTGFFIDDNGYILTNHHVIADNVDPKFKGYSKVYVTTRKEPDKEIPAEVIGYDKVFDIALLKIPFKSENHLTLGRSSDMQVGDKIYTIGNPIGIKYTVTSGIISNKDLEVFQLGKAFMIDAAVNPGNSGGPLIDERGQVIGIVFAGIPQYQGISFAIPFQWVRKTISALYKKGEVQRCWLGAGIYADNDKVFFYYVLPSGPAYKSGIAIGDRIIKIDGIEVSSVEDAQSKLAWKRFPELINLEIERNGKVMSIVVRLEQRPYLPVEEVFDRDTKGNIFSLLFGIGLDYYDKKFFTNKYKILKVYKKMEGMPLNVNAGDPLIIYDIKLLQKEKMITVTIQYLESTVGVVNRVVTLASPAEVNTIL
jgi:S1-C subfamily serine protease